MKSAELVIKGSKVIGVGYRPFLLLNAMYLGVEKFFAFNAREDDKETVIIRVRGEGQNITQYIEFAKTNFPEHARVEEVTERNYEGPVMYTDKFLQLLQFEQISKAVPAIINIDRKQDIMIGKHDIMIGKQDLTISILGNMKEDTSAIKNDISALRKDTSDMLYEKYEQLSREIADIKATLSEMKAKAS
jgi:acylphosphatase